MSGFALKVGRTTAVGFLTVIFLASSSAWADPNLLRMGDSIVIRLPEQPSEQQLREEFAQLSPVEQRWFYYKRRFIIQRLVAGLSRPGLRQGLRWVKNKVFPLKSQPVSVAADLEWERIPNNLSIETKGLIESTVSSLVENMWRQSGAMARSSGLGFTFVGGAIFNTSLVNKGFVWGRSRSVDIGVDFARQSGYVRLFSDSQTLSRAGLSFDVGVMADALVHVTDGGLVENDQIEATHVKLPFIGCFRSAANYKAWGLQAGLHVVEMLGLWLGWAGYPTEGAAAIAGMRMVGAATVYSTNLERRLLKAYEVPEKWMRRFGFSQLWDLAHEFNGEQPGPVDEKSCSSLLTGTQGAQERG